MKLYLVRHAQSKANTGIFDGENHLTDLGKEQARRLGTYFENVGIDSVFCSTSSRTKDTLEEILPYIKDVDVNYTDKIKEHNTGIYHKLPNFPKNYFEAIEKSGKSFYEFEPEEGESYLQLLERAKNFYDSLIEDYIDKNVLIVSHQQFTKALILNILGLDVSEEKYFKINNASVSTFDIDKEAEVKESHINDFNHILNEGVKRK